MKVIKHLVPFDCIVSHDGGIDVARIAHRFGNRFQCTVDERASVSLHESLRGYQKRHAVF